MRIRFLSATLGCVLFASGGLALADTPANPNENQLIIRSDGFTYLVRNGTRHLVVPVSVPDEDISAIPEGEPYLNGLMPIETGSAPASASLAGAPPAPTPTATPGTSTSVPSGPITIALGDYSIDANPSAVKAGKVTFNIENDGKLRHELIVFRSDLDTAALPVSSGKVIEANVGKKIGEVEGLKTGDSESATFDLEAGHYVLLCNISGHYAKGMVSSLDVK